ncbi:FkbM family methyltransferase [Cyclobacterium sp. SYSU L10401]|uniref:FkbM family methyltransferase n=1 Tax=Cyclobacterium sp. SYSU L10401 TaxID=2678657 RepID=UPI0013D178C7|nr:FkbM family methyltransferase [Cyclobacterium sp. SYSU L10401]
MHRSPFSLRKRKNKTAIGDIDILDEVLISDCYHLNDLKFDNEINVLDIGANIGAFAWSIQSIFDIANLICIEPDESFDYLVENSKPKQVEKVFCLKGACGFKKHGYYTANINNSGGGKCSSIYTFGAEKVKSINLKKVLQHLKINDLHVVKIDTEGMEVPILLELLNIDLRIRNVLIETHSDEEHELVLSLIKKFGHKEIYLLNEVKSSEGHFRILHSR